jgi:hypothetical protein
VDGQYEGLILERLQQHGERLASLETAVTAVRADVAAIRERLEERDKGVGNHWTLKAGGIVGGAVAGLAAAAKALGWW